MGIDGPIESEQTKERTGNKEVMEDEATNLFKWG